MRVRPSDCPRTWHAVCSRLTVSAASTHILWLIVFQGSSIGLAFWHPSSHMPEYGLCRFATEAKAQAYVDFLASPSCPEPLNRADLVVEGFNHAEHERLITEYPQASAWETPL